MATTDEQIETTDVDESLDASGAEGEVEAVDGSKRSSALAVNVERLIAGVRDNPKRAAIVGGGIVLLVGVILYFTTNQGPEAHQMLTQALMLLEDREIAAARHQARQIARKLEKLEYRHPDFSGATEYILGIVAFRDAQDSVNTDVTKQYSIASEYLTDASNQKVAPEHKPEWSYALGVSLHELGSASKALPRLIEALETFPSARIDSLTRLIDIYLDRKTLEDVEKSLVLSNQLIETDGLVRGDRDRAYLQRAQIFLAMNREEDAEEALSHVSQGKSGSHGTKVFRGQTLMADREYTRALELFKSVAEDIGPDRIYPRQASYLMGVCAEEQSKAEGKSSSFTHQAINYFKRTAHTYEASHEGVAANLHLGDLLRETGAHEEALLAYQKALQTVRSPEDFRNRWISLEEFRNVIRGAWDKWVESRKHQFAIDLSQLMTPLLSEVEAYTYSARAHQNWAEQLEKELAESSYSAWIIGEDELRRRWRLSGKAYASLAKSLKTTADYHDYLWISSEHYRNGNDFESAMQQLDIFIKLQPEELLPVAFVRRGEILIDLNRSQDDLNTALEHFHSVVSSYPTAPAAFEARYLIGKCQLELNELELARRAWESILESEDLAPSAKEWRMSLFSLGRLLYYLGEMHKTKIEDSQTVPTLEELVKISPEGFQHWKESISRLDEFLKRYPEDESAPEARFLLARSMRQSALLPLQKLADAETENARAELTSSMEGYLRDAIKEFRQLQDDLVKREEVDRLDDLGQQILRNCFFEIAHTFYALKNYDEAIIAYSGAANRYAQDPRILLAYIQMSNCYDYLGKDVEARSMIEQAKVIKGQLPPNVFEEQGGEMDVESWSQWLDWARELRQPVTLKRDGTS